MTAVEWLEEKFNNDNAKFINWSKEYFEEAKEIEKTNLDNKVIHFAEWLTKKHTTTLMALYEHFEEEHYNEKL